MKPTLHVTVAAIVEAQGRYLLVAERIGGRRVINQPAGHWELDETLSEAVIRETREETGHDFTPRGLVGVYQWPHPDGADLFLRFAFYGDARPAAQPRVLDAEIDAVLWWTRQEIESATLPRRSPQVLRCIDDYERGARYSLDCLKQIPPATVGRR